MLNKESLKYLKLTDKGAPVGGWDNYYTYEKVKDYDGNVAVAIEYPYVVIDVDGGDDDVDIICDLLEKAEIGHALMYTDHGAHIWLKTQQPMKNVIDADTIIGVPIDIKSHGKKSMVTHKKGGKWRTFWYIDDEIHQIPQWLQPIPMKEAERLPEYWNLTERGKRHKACLASVYPLARSGWSPDEIYEALIFLNQHVLPSPLDEADIVNMTLNNETLIDECFSDRIVKKNKAGELVEELVFRTNKVANHLIRKLPMTVEDGALYVRNEKKEVYEVNGLLIESMIHRPLPNLNESVRKEIIKKIVLNLTLQPPSFEKLGVHDVVVNNGILNLKSGRTRPITNVFNKTKLPVTYKRSAKSKVLDEFMKKITKGDEQTEDLIYEMISYTLVNHANYQKAFLLLGRGSNGKSVLMDLIHHFLGDNTSTVPLDKLSDINQRGQMLGKYANIGDDIGDKLKESEHLKSIAAGKKLTVKKLYLDPFEAPLTAKLIYGCNELPYSKDKTDGFHRRWVIIPFNAIFMPSDPDFDPHIDAKLQTREVCEALLVKCVEAYQRLEARKSFTTSDNMVEVLNEYRRDNDAVFAFLESFDLNKVELYQSFENFKVYAALNGYKKIPEIRAFTKRIKSLSSMTLENYRSGNKHLRRWRVRK